MAKKVCISLLAVLAMVTVVLLWNSIITTSEMKDAQIEGLKGLSQAYYEMARYYLDGENDQQRILSLNNLHVHILLMLPIRERNVFRGGQDRILYALRQQSEALYDLVHIEGRGGTPELNTVFKQEMAESLLLLSLDIAQYVYVRDVSDRSQQSREAIISRAEVNIEIHRRWKEDKSDSLPGTQ